MPLSTYSGLVAAIPSHMFNNTSLTTAVCQDLVTLAEAQINRRLRVRRMLAYAVAVIEGEYSALPPDFAGERTFELQTDPVARLVFRAQSETDALHTDFPAAGKPQFFTIVGSEFRFMPVPDAAYTAKLTYYQRIPPLSDAAETNWLLDDHPDVYLYGALYQAALYLKNPDEASGYAALFTTLLDDVMSADKVDGYGGRLVMRGRRI